MTISYKKAIDIINAIFRDYSYGCDDNTTEHSDYTQFEKRQALAMGRHALGFRIPKQPICPSCAGLLDRKKNICTDCGQFIDWGDDNA